MINSLGILDNIMVGITNTETIGSLTEKAFKK